MFTIANLLGLDADNASDSRASSPAMSDEVAILIFFRLVLIYILGNCATGSAIGSGKEEEEAASGQKP